MTPAKSVLAAILLAATAWSRSSQKYDRSGRGLPARGAFGRYPTNWCQDTQARIFPPGLSPGVSPSSMTPTTRATLRKSSHPTAFDAFCFCVCMVPCLALISYLMIPIPTTFDRARRTAKCCFAVLFYYYPAYLI
ncbi:hypothetical protein EDB89DRAFT_1954914 [Lactarius sanguifluus]|nr:hypothetical protein EDB89DRAFT_1954914 [Lactarius sanguifluus]